MTAPSATRFVAENIPASLKADRNWVTFRTYPKPDGRLGKMPLVPETDRAARIDDPATWRPYDDAVAAAEARDLWLGFAIGADLNMTLVDQDGVIDEDGTVSEPAARLIAELDSYSERSASRRGTHTICEGRPPAGCAKPLGVEVYPGRRFVLITGDLLPGLGRATIEDRTDRLAALFPGRPVAARLPGAGPSRRTDDDVLARAFAARNGPKVERLWRGETAGHGDDESSADLALLSMLAFWTQDPDQLDRLFRRSGLYRPKWERASYRAPTIAKALVRAEVYRPRPRIAASSLRLRPHVGSISVA